MFLLYVEHQIDKQTTQMTKGKVSVQDTTLLSVSWKSCAVALRINRSRVRPFNVLALIKRPHLEGRRENQRLKDDR